jgi:hypothetical protein
VIGIVWHSDFEGTSAKGYFGDMQNGAGIPNTLFEGPKQLITGAETLGIGYRRHYMEAVRKGLDVALRLRSVVDERWCCHI